MATHPTELERLRKLRSDRNAKQVRAANNLTQALRTMLRSDKGTMLGKRLAKVLDRYDASISAPDAGAYLLPSGQTLPAVATVEELAEATTYAEYQLYMETAKQRNFPLFTYSGWLRERIRTQLGPEPVVPPSDAEFRPANPEWEVSVDGTTWFVAAVLGSGPSNSLVPDIWRTAVRLNGRRVAVKFWRKLSLQNTLNTMREDWNKRNHE